MPQPDKIVRDKLAFEIDEGGYHFVATYLTEPAGEALVEITKDGAMVKSILWPAYKIWNIAAHAADIASEIEEGLLVAGATGFGGNVYTPDTPHEAGGDTSAV